MAYDNINFYKPNMAVKSGYFYLLDDVKGILIRKLADGKTAFQYPIDVSNDFTDYAVNDIICLQYDGYSFWSLQVFTDASGVLLRRWVVDNFLCKLHTQIPKINTASVIYDVGTFSVESYSTKLTNDAARSSYELVLDEYTDSTVFVGSVIGIGYNRFSERELVIVDYIDGNTIHLVEPLNSNYYAGDDIVITPTIFMFNNYTGVDNSIGSLLMMDANDGSYITEASDVEYSDITASKFCRLQVILQDHPDVHTLSYTKGTNLKLRDVSDMYRYSADIKGSDDFTGIDDSAPDDENWSITSGNPTLYNNKLYCSTIGVGHDKVTSKYTISGDFSVQVSGTVVGFTTFSGLTDFSHYMQLYSPSSLITAGIRYKYYSSTPITAVSLEFYYAFDGDANDSSGNGYDATVYGATPTTDRHGLPDGAYYFDGTNDYIATPYYFSTANIFNFTISVWVKVPSDGGDWSILDFGRSEYFTCAVGVPNGVTNGVGDYIGFFTTDSSSGVSDMWSTSGGIRDDQWHNILWAFDGATKYIYIDNVLDSTQAVSSIGNGSTRYGIIGDGSEATAFGGPKNELYFKGSMDELRFYSRDLTTPEIQTIFNDGGPERIVIESYLDDTPIQSFEITGEYDPAYLFKITKQNSDMSFSFQCSTSGIFPETWTDLSSITDSYSYDLSLGLSSSLVTVSGSYFDDLTYTSGYICYPTEEATYYGIMGMDNIQIDQSTVITIHDIDVEDDNLFRLQTKANYYGSDVSWSTYNYQVSPIRSFVDFITVDADTYILPATGRNTAVLTAVVFDQYGQGVVNRAVTFIDDDSVGFVTTEVVHTDVFFNTGKAETAYTSGTSLRVVTIEATVTQVD